MDIYQIFEDLSIPKSRSLSDCPDGWLQLARDCLEEMIAAGWDKQLYQFKEKFGALRIYVANNDPNVNEVIRKYEALSYETCQGCGDRGRLYQDECWATLCASCQQKATE